jgi:hypothetical protein
MPDTLAEADVLRETERRRLQALVAADPQAIERVHAPEFEVINPLGRVQSRAPYLSAIYTGTTDYLAWEIDSVIRVRFAGANAAVLRYRSQVDMVVEGYTRPRAHAWNTAYYERGGDDGSWKIVWFHVTEIQ